MKFREIFSVLALAASAASSTLVGCGSAGPAQSSSENVGAVRADLVATGPNGDSYTLPTSAYLELTQTSVDGGSPLIVQFDQSTPTQTFSVPSGPYSAVLEPGAPWTLVDLTTNTSVSASLLDSSPYEFTVGPGKTYTLQFHFQLAGVGDVTFGTGDLATQLNVAAADGGAATSGSVTPTNVVLQQEPQPTSDPNLLQLATAVQQGLPATFSLMNLPFSITSDFAPQVDSACASIVLNVPMVMPIDDSLPDAGDTIAVDLFDEALFKGATGEICLYDSNGSTSNDVIIQFERIGVASTPTVRAQLASGYSADFVSVLVAQAATPLYDGTTAHLSQLTSATTMNLLEAEIVVNPSDKQPLFVVGQGSSGTSTITLQLNP